MRKYAIITLLLLSFLCKAPTLDVGLYEKKIIEIKEYAEKLRIERETNLYIEKLMFVTRIVETSDNYFAVGSSGEFGAYQFMPGSWRLWCLIHFGEELSIYNPENQDKVAKAELRKLHDAGYNHKEIAAIWNSGKPKWKGRRGVNKFGVYYDV